MTKGSKVDSPVGFKTQRVRPTRILWITIVSVLGADGLFELSLLYLPESPHFHEALNSLFILIVVLPVMYLMMFRPMKLLIGAYQKALYEIRTLRGIIPICSHCKKVRTGKRSWEQVESYVATHTEAQFSHGICNDCIRKLYPEDADEIIEQMDATDG